MKHIISALGLTAVLISGAHADIQGICGSKEKGYFSVVENNTPHDVEIAVIPVYPGGPGSKPPTFVNTLSANSSEKEKYCLYDTVTSVTVFVTLKDPKVRKLYCRVSKDFNQNNVVVQTIKLYVDPKYNAVRCSTN